LAQKSRSSSSDAKFGIGLIIATVVYVPFSHTICIEYLEAAPYLAERPLYEFDVP